MPRRAPTVLTADAFCVSVQQFLRAYDARNGTRVFKQLLPPFSIQFEPDHPGRAVDLTRVYAHYFQHMRIDRHSFDVTLPSPNAFAPPSHCVLHTPAGFVAVFATCESKSHGDAVSFETPDAGSIPCVRCIPSSSVPLSAQDPRLHMHLLVAVLRKCAQCGVASRPTQPLLHCHACKDAGQYTAYCSRTCQEAHWRTHKAVCAGLVLSSKLFDDRLLSGKYAPIHELILGGRVVKEVQLMLDEPLQSINLSFLFPQYTHGIETRTRALTFMNKRGGSLIIRHLNGEALVCFSRLRIDREGRFDFKRENRGSGHALLYVHTQHDISVKDDLRYKLLIAIVPMRVCAFCHTKITTPTIPCARCLANGIHVLYCCLEHRAEHASIHRPVCGH